MRSSSLLGPTLDVLTLLAAVGAVGLVAFAAKDRLGRVQAPAPRPVTRSTILPADFQKLSAAGHRMGPANAHLTILEFGDFECPACGAIEPTLRAMREAHPKDVAVVFRHWPLEYHHLAYPAARAAECAAKQGRFAAYHDLLYSRQDSLGLIPFHSFAIRSGVPDLAAFDTCDAQSGLVPDIQNDIAEAKRIGGRGTPTLIINGAVMDAPPDSAALEDMLRASR